MFNIRFFSARYGDAIRIAYGEPTAPRLVLIDGGTGGTREQILADLKDYEAKGGILELIVVTHVDRDHIEGILRLLEDEDFTLPVGDFWFNGWPQLPQDEDDEEFGPVQGERLSTQIRRRDLKWNQAFGGRAVVIPKTGALPEIRLEGGLTITLLNPTLDHLEGLKEVWVRELRLANLDPGFGLKEPIDDEEDDEDEAFGVVCLPNVAKLAASDYTDDKSKANLSSIALIAEYGKTRVLLAGDAPAGPVLAALDRLSPAAQLEVDLFKISHHGSKHTTSRDLVEKVLCPLYVISTNGACYKHPDQESVARVIAAAGRPLTLAFNYRSGWNEIWDDAELRKEHAYETRFPEAGHGGLDFDVSGRHSGEVNAAFCDGPPISNA
jgi:prepilin-type processing-associated H-X9-DG protein